MTHDFIPGINVGNIWNQAGNYLSQLTGGKPIDYDIVDNYTLASRPSQTPVWGTQNTADNAASVLAESRLASPASTPTYTYVGTDTPYFDSNTYETVATPTGPTPEEQAQIDYNAEVERQRIENERIAAEEARIKAENTANEIAAYNDQITNLDKLLGYTQTQRESGTKSIEDQYNYNKQLQDQALNAQRLANEQAREKGYNEVGNFANTSYNNLNRLLQGANAGRSSVGQILAPYMVGRSADIRRQGVTDTAGQNAANIDTTANTSYQNLANKKKESTQSFLDSLLGQQQTLESQKYSAQVARDLASGQNYQQAQANAATLTANMDARQAELAGLFDKYKPDYTVQAAPDLSKYTVDPAVIAQSQANPGENSFYQTQIKKRKELGL